ncbi:hypothetical protein NYA30BAC_03280 [Halomonas sp. NYA30]
MQFRHFRHPWRSDEKAEHPGMGLQRVRVCLISRAAHNIFNAAPLVGEVYRTERTL